MTPPTYLSEFDRTEDCSFEPAERFYRRFTGNPFQPIPDVFSQIKWTDVAAGLSLNRSKYSNDPTDVMWAELEDIENRSCDFHLKVGRPGVAIGPFPWKDPQSSAEFNIQHTPTNCNRSHCDLVFTSVLASLSKKQQKDVKAFLASFFKEV
ncbi:hypothetical protein [Flavitalea sp.]|nr:hypothetical protein [Flavitalea sp.]